MRQRHLIGDRAWLGAVSVLIPVGIVVAVVVLTARHGMYDLRIYRDSIKYWVDGQSLYEFERGPFRQGFTYPPFAALCMLPLALVSYPLAVGLSYAIGIACVAFIVAMVGLPTFERFGWPVLTAVAWSVALALFLQPYRDTLSFGQINLILLAMIIADGHAIQRGWRYAGLGIGIATAIKLTPGFFILFLLLAGRRRTAVVALAAAVGSTLFAAVVAPASSWQFWGEAVFDTSRVGLYESTLNQSLAGLVARLNDPAPLASIPWALAALCIGAFGIWRAKRAFHAGDLPVALAITGLTGSLISPITWVHHLVWVGPAIMHLAAAGLRRGQHRWIVAAVGFTALFALSVPARLAAPPGEHWSGGWPHQLGESTILFGVLLLVAVLPWDGPGRPADDEPGSNLGRAGRPVIRT